MAAPIISALLGAALLLHPPARVPAPCSSASLVLQLRCDEVDSGALGPLCAEAIGYTYDAFEGAVCLVVVPVVAAPDERRVDHQGAPAGARPQGDAPANRARAPGLPRPLLAAAQHAAAHLEGPGDRVTAPPPSPG